MLVKTPASSKVLWSSIIARNTSGQVRANSYYRVMVPFMTMKDMNLIDDYYIEGWSNLGPSAGMEEKALMGLLSDVILLSNTFGEVLVKNVQSVKKLRPATDPDTLERIYPPVCVFDQDDLTEYVSVFNDTYRNLGTRGPNGEELEEGAIIKLPDPNGGEPLTLWEDGHCPHCDHGVCIPGIHQTWDLKRNRKVLEVLYGLARSCHGATFSSPHLEAFYRDRVGLKNTYFFPNSIYAKDYHRIDLAEHPDEVRILWQGGSSHFADWYPYADSLGKVVKKHKNVKMIFWGQPFGWVMRHIPEEQREFISWVPHAAYLSRLNTLGHDINLAPLAPGLFNECKSAIKWYESSAICRPAATLAQMVPPYSDEMLDGETGLLFNNPAEFEEKLDGLIVDATLRKRLASNAKDWVYENRDSRKTVPGLLDFYWSLRKQYDEEDEGG